MVTAIDNSSNFISLQLNKLKHTESKYRKLIGRLISCITTAKKMSFPHENLNLTFCNLRKLLKKLPFARALFSVGFTSPTYRLDSFKRILLKNEDKILTVKMSFYSDVTCYATATWCHDVIRVDLGRFAHDHVGHFFSKRCTTTGRSLLPLWLFPRGQDGTDGGHREKDKWDPKAA